MAKATFKDKKDLSIAKQTLHGAVEFRQTKHGIVAAKVKRSKKK